MGWSNYILIPGFGVAIEISRYVEELGFEGSAIEKFLADEDLKAELEAIREADIKEMSFGELGTLSQAVTMLLQLPDEIEKYFLYFLEQRGIKYEIVSEFKLKFSDGYATDKEGRKYKIIPIR